MIIGVVTEKRRRWFRCIDDSRAGSGDDADVVAAARAKAKADAESCRPRRGDRTRLLLLATGKVRITSGDEGKQTNEGDTLRAAIF